MLSAYPLGSGVDVSIPLLEKLKRLWQNNPKFLPVKTLVRRRIVHHSEVVEYLIMHWSSFQIRSVTLQELLSMKESEENDFCQFVARV